MRILEIATITDMNCKLTIHSDTHCVLLFENPPRLVKKLDVEVEVIIAFIAPV